MKVDDLLNLLTQIKGQKEHTPSQTQSPFTLSIRCATLPSGFRGIGDLRFSGNTDPAEYLGTFSIEMKVYLMEDLTQCRILTSSLRGNAL